MRHAILCLGYKGEVALPLLLSTLSSLSVCDCLRLPAPDCEITRRLDLDK
jgi:hypothetical protein